MKTRGFLLAAAVAAMVFTFSCSSDDEGGEGGGSSSSVGTQGGEGGSSSSGGSGNRPSSSSPLPNCGSLAYNPATQYCSNETIKNYESFLPYEGQTYKTVVIGKQTWFAENLNYDVEGSKCHSCEKYGRLYDWETALTVCPSGWDLASNSEWDELLRFVDGDTGPESPYSSPSAAIFLKAADGWGDRNGTDDHGFSALPGGSYTRSFSNAGLVGYWWGASISGANYRSIGSSSIIDLPGVYAGFTVTSNFNSVRCLQDRQDSDAGLISINSVSECSGVEYNTATQYCSNGTLKDYVLVPYEGQTYKTVVIGEQTWFAENLNYKIEGSKCYDNYPANCAKYGRLYNWSIAMGFNASCNGNGSSCADQIETPHQGICPDGWHIPSEADLEALITAVGGINTAGTNLKAKNGWYSNGYGTDSYGFSALPGSGGNVSGGFEDIGKIGNWWIASEDESGNGRRLNMNYENENARLANTVKSYSISVRCVKD